MRHTLTKTSRRCRLSAQLSFILSVLIFSNISFAELEELDEKQLEELRGKEGITIDLSYKLSIGEIAWDFSDRELDDDQPHKTLAPPPPRIEYHHNSN